MHSPRASFESFDTASHMIFDRESDDTARTTLVQSPSPKRSREEDAPLLNAFDIEDNTIYYPRRSKKHLPSIKCCTKRTLIIGFCLFVLPVLSFILFCAIYFSPTRLPSITAEAPESSSARLLTLNIFMRPPGIKNNADDYKDERLDYIVDHILPSYDIITVQEAFAFANRRIDKLTTEAFNRGFQYQVASPRHYPWELAGDGGLLILSRFPIVKSDKIEFPRGVHSDWLSFKGALHALIQINNQSLVHLYTTHTQASYDKEGSFNLGDTKVRLSQFAAVHQFIAETAKDDNHPILIMGDLNVDAAVHNSTVDTPSRASSLAYTMMMDVLKGKGVDLDRFNNNTSSNTKLSYSHLWRLDDLEDVAYNTFGYHPVTFGDYKTLSDGSLVPAEVILTHHNQLMTVQSIDRLLWVNQGKTNMAVTNVTLEPFLTFTDYPFTQISDHYGISSLLKTT